MELLGLGLVRVAGEWQRLFEDRTVEANQRVQKAFGNNLAGVATYLRLRGYRVTAASHKALVGHPQAPMPFLHVVVSPRIARKQYIDPSLAGQIQAAVLSVSLVYDTPEVPDHARTLPAEFGAQAVGKYGWVRVEPYRMTNVWTRLEFVCNFDQFVTDDAHMTESLLAACKEIVGRLLA